MITNFLVPELEGIDVVKRAIKWIYRNKLLKKDYFLMDLYFGHVVGAIWRHSIIFSRDK